MLSTADDGQYPFIEVDDLLPDTTYTVEVYAVNVDDLGEFAGPGSDEEFSFTTLAFRKYNSIWSANQAL